VDSVKRVLHPHFIGADKNESPMLSLADIKHVFSSNSNSASNTYDPIKALQSLEDVTILQGLKYYWFHLVCSTVRDVKQNVNNCIWDTWVFPQYFDVLNIQDIGVPLIAVRYISTAEHTEDIHVHNCN